MISKLLPSNLRPLPNTLTGVSCCSCNKPKAFWSFANEAEYTYICSLCFLNDTEWAQNNKRIIDHVVASIDEAREIPLVKDINKNVCSVKEANDVLGLIVLTQRIRKAHGVIGHA